MRIRIALAGELPQRTDSTRGIYDSIENVLSDIESRFNSNSTDDMDIKKEMIVIPEYTGNEWISLCSEKKYDIALYCKEKKSQILYVKWIKTYISEP